MRASRGRPGTLFLVAGPSGAGKDTLIAGARRCLAGNRRFFFPRRVITRPADAGGETHEAMEPQAFTAAEEAGAFVLSWRAHGLAYGLPRSVAAGLESGSHGVVNVSRTMIAEARRRFARVHVILVEASAANLAGRLGRRRRESPAAQAARLERAPAVPVGGDVTRLPNDGPKHRAIADLVAILESVGHDQERRHV